MSSTEVLTPRTGLKDANHPSPGWVLGQQTHWDFFSSGPQGRQELVAENPGKRSVEPSRLLCSEREGESPSTILPGIPTSASWTLPMRRCRKRDL